MRTQNMKSLNKKDCYNHGYNIGYDIAKSNMGDYTKDNEEKFIEDMSTYESDEFRQYSPFEFFAHDINQTGDRADGLWDSYDNGVYKGILAAIRGNPGGWKVIQDDGNKTPFIDPLDYLLKEND